MFRKWGPESGSGYGPLFWDPNFAYEMPRCQKALSQKGPDMGIPWLRNLILNATLNRPAFWFRSGRGSTSRTASLLRGARHRRRKPAAHFRSNRFACFVRLLADRCRASTRSVSPNNPISLTYCRAAASDAGAAPRSKFSSRTQRIFRTSAIHRKASDRTL